jgi:carbamoyltransferase
VGAALYAHHRLTNAPRQPQLFFGIGPSFENDIEAFLAANRIAHETAEPAKLYRRLAEAIAGGKIAGFYQGGAEFGPRALGFRSILADPRDNRMKEKINAAVKYREVFRPFAPAVMSEHASEYFDCDRDAPYMLLNFMVRPDKRSAIPAVTHVDNSSRIQTVTEQNNGPLYRLLAEFRAITGVPVLLNTSFNLRGHPIVNTPEDAFATFCSGGIDILLLGTYLIQKQDISTSLIQRFRFEKSDD